MESRVFVGRVPSEPFMEISSDGSMTNPIIAAFSLRDTKITKTFKETLYVIVYNTSISYVQLKVNGTIPGVQLKIAWSDQEDRYGTTIEQEVTADATGTSFSIPFFIKFEAVDDLSVLLMDEYANELRVRLLYT